MVTEGMNPSEQDPLAHLLGDAGVEDNPENREEAKEVRASFATAREADTNITPEGKEGIEGEVAAKQEQVMDKSTQAVGKVLEFQRRLQSVDPQMRRVQEATVTGEINRAQAKQSLYSKLGWGGFTAGTLSALSIATIAALEGAGIIPKAAIDTNMAALLFGGSAALMLGSPSVIGLAGKWKSKLEGLKKKN